MEDTRKEKATHILLIKPGCISSPVINLKRQQHHLETCLETHMPVVISSIFYPLLYIIEYTYADRIALVFMDVGSLD